MKDKFNYLLLSEDKLREMKKRMAASGLSFLNVPIQRVQSESDYYPLSYAQKSIWFLSELDESAASYNLCNAVRIKTALRTDILIDSLHYLIGKHESLRTRFISRNAVLYQYISDACDLDISVVCLEDNEDKEAALLKLLRDESAKPFDIQADRLIKVIVYKLAETDYVIFLNMHHIIADGISLQMLSDELFAVYTAMIGNEPLIPEAHSVRYVDYARWQNDWVCEELLEKELNYWKAALNEIPELCTLPPDYQRPAISSYDGDIAFMTLDANVLQQLVSFCRANHITLFHLALAVFMIMIHKYTGEEDILVGTPVSGRLHTETEKLIGFFANSIILRSFIDDDSSVKEIIGTVSKTTLDALANQAAPLTMVMDSMNRSKSGNESPFHLFFIFNSDKGRQTAFDIEPIAFGNRKAKYDITFEITEREDRLDIGMEYSTQLYTPETIRVFLNRFKTILTAVISNPSARLSDLSLLTQEQAERVLYSLNDTFRQPPPQGTLLQLIEIQAKKTPEALAILADGEKLTYRELMRRIDNAAAFLIRRGIKQYGCVGICMEPDPGLPIILLAVMKAGCAYVPLDYGLPEKRITYIKKEADLSVIISNQERHKQNEEPGILYIGTDSALWRESGHGEIVWPCVCAEDIAYIMFTSGSTGNPKGVMVTQRNIVNFLYGMQEKLKLGIRDSILSLTTYSFDISVLELFLPLVCGAHVIMTKHRIAMDMPRLRAAISQYHPTVMQATPPLWQLLISGGWQGDQQMTALCGGDVLSAALASELIERCKTVWNMYGPTETTVWSLMHQLHKDDVIVPIGRPIANTSAYILDKNKKPTPMGITGDLFIGGAGVSNGYSNNPEETKRRFVPDPYDRNGYTTMFRTGDRAKYLQDGSITFEGRDDHQIKVRGFRIETSEIELKLNQHPSINACAVVAARDTGGEKVLAAYIKFNEKNAEPSSADLRLFLKKDLPDYMIPSAFIALDELPLSYNMKTDKKQLMNRPLSLSDHREAYTAPKTENERKLAAIWERMMGREKISINEDFFDLGGHSIKAMQIIDAVQTEFKLDIPLSWLFKYPTISGFAAALSEALENNGLYDSDKPLLIMPDAEHKHEPFSLTQVQRAYWLGRHSKDGLGGTSTHIYQELELIDFNTQRFNLALKNVISRHEMLRAIVLDNGMQQILKDNLSYQAKSIDLRLYPEEEKQRRLTEIRDEMAHQVFDAEVWPLFDLRVSLLGDRRCRLHISIDCIIGDARSFQIILNDLVKLLSDTNARLDPFEISFRDYVVALESQKDSPRFQRDKDYWRRKTDIMPGAPLLTLKTDPESAYKPKFTRYTRTLPKELWEALTSMAQKNRVTKTVLLLTAFSEILALWSKKACFTLNLTLFDRLPLHREINDIVGDFTTVCLLEADMRSGLFLDRARKMQNQLVENLEHRMYSGIDVTMDMIKAGRISESLPVVFTSLIDTYDNDASFEQALQIVNREETERHNITQTPNVWLDHQAMAYKDELYVNWDVAEELFTEGMIREMFTDYCQLLCKLAEDRVWYEADPLSNADSGYCYLKKLNAVLNDHKTAEIGEDLLCSGFMRCAKAYPQACAVITSERSISYRELDIASDAIARQITAAGKDRSELIGIVMHKGWEQIAAVFGVLKAGLAFVPIDANLPVSRIEALIDLCDISLVLTQAMQEEMLSHNTCERIIVDEAMLHVSLTPEDKLTGSGVSGDDTAYIIFTSGSTGTPKGVVITHKSAVNTIYDVNRRFEVGPKDSVFSLSSLSFDLSIYDIFGLLSVGGHIILPDSDSIRDPSHWHSLLLRHPCTIWNSVPSFMKMYTAYLDDDLPMASLRLVLMSGDWIDVALPEKIKRHNPAVQVVSLGGATECAIWSIIHPIEEKDASLASIPYGRAMCNQTVHVLNDRLQKCPIGITGEIYIGGIGLAVGYWKDPEKTAASFIVHPVTQERLYKTGDLGKYRADGEIILLGRDDGQIKLGGFRIELGEIQSAIQKFEYVKDTVVVKSGEHLLTAFIVPSRNFIDEPDPQIIINPLERNIFKLRRHGVRDMTGLPEIRLLSHVSDEQYLKRRSFRRFINRGIPFESFERLLSLFASRNFEDAIMPKYLYASAGSAYPVQIYISIKPNAIDNVDAGYYYYDPSKNRLICLGETSETEDNIHVRENLNIYRSAGFTIFLLSDLTAIAPLYGEDNAKLYSLIEAGLITQLLEMKGTDHNIGFCQIGALDFNILRQRFRLHERYMYIHALLGGYVDKEMISSRTFLQESEQDTELRADQLPAIVSKSEVRQALEVFLKSNLPEYMIPKKIEFVASLPITANGKVDIARLKRLSEDQPLSDERRSKPKAAVTPEDHIVRQIHAIWREILETDALDIDDNFFEVGGDSFKIIQMHKLFKAQFGRTFEIVNLFRYPTIAKQAMFLSQIDTAHPYKTQLEKRMTIRDRHREHRNLGKR